VHDVRFLATHNTNERILEKYKDKLGRKAKEEGLHNISALREAYKARIEAARKTSLSINAEERPISTQKSPKEPFDVPHAGNVPPPPPVSSAAPDAAKSDAPGVKTLSSFLDVDKTLHLPPKEIEMLWRLRHASNPSSLCAVIPADTYAHMALMARKHPQFILPLPKEGQGAEIHFLQWTFPRTHTANILFTHLAEYKLRGEFASPHTTLTMHQELVQPKGLVLAEGTVMDSRGVNVEEGKFLLMCLQKFYGVQAGERDRRKRLLEQFTSGDSTFDIKDLLDEAERIG